MAATTTTYAHNNSGIAYYGRTAVATYRLLSAIGTQVWFRIFGSQIDLQCRSGGATGAQISVDGGAFTGVTTTTAGTPAWTTAWTGAEGWHDVVVTINTGIPITVGSGLVFNLAAMVRVTGTDGNEQLIANFGSGSYEQLGTTPFTTYGKHSYPTTDSTGGYTSPSQPCCINYLSGVRGGNCAVRRKATWTSGSRLYVWVANSLTASYPTVKIDGISYGITAGTIVFVQNGWRYFDLPGAGSHEIEVINSPACDAIMISDMAGGSGASFLSESSAAKTYKLASIGDSQTQGVGSGLNGTQGFSFDSLASQITDADVYNLGVSGNTTSQMLARFAADITPHSPHYLVVHAGYNNTAGATFRTDYKALLDKAILDLPSLRNLFCLKINDHWSNFAGLNADIDQAVSEWLAINTTWASKLVVIPNDPSGVTTDVANAHISGIGYGQMHGDNTSTIKLTGQPSDGDTISITANGTTKVYEFDSNASVTGGNVSVTIEASTTATNYNLFLAMVAQFEAGFTAKPLNRVNDLYTIGCSISKTSAITKSGTNIAVTGPFSTGVGQVLQSYVGVWPLSASNAKNALLMGVG